MGLTHFILENVFLMQVCRTKIWNKSTRKSLQILKMFGLGRPKKMNNTGLDFLLYAGLFFLRVMWLEINNFHLKMTWKFFTTPRSTGFWNSFISSAFGRRSKIVHETKMIYLYPRWRKFCSVLYLKYFTTWEMSRVINFHLGFK